MIVPDLPPEIRELKERVCRFVEEEAYPLEERIAERGSIDAEEVEALRRKAREAGLAMLNMPPENGGIGLSMLGQVAIEEESGKATNGLGFAIVDRGPRELLELVTPNQAERFVEPIVRGEWREAWALTEPARPDPPLVTTAVRDGEDWLLNGEKWFVTSEGEPGVYVVAAVADGEQQLFLVEPGTPGLEIVRTPGFLHDPYLDHHPELELRDCRVPEANRVPASGDAGAKEWILVERLFIAARCCGASLRLLDLASEWAQEREAFGSRIADYQGVSFPLADSLTELHAARLLTYHAAHAFDALADRKVVHGKVSMAKLFASETAGRIADRAVQVLGGRGYSVDSPAARHSGSALPTGSGGTRDPALIIAGGSSRGAAPYLGWELRGHRSRRRRSRSRAAGSPSASSSDGRGHSGDRREASAALSTESDGRPLVPVRRAAPRSPSSSSRASSAEVGASATATSRCSSARIPPRPTRSTGPKRGSQRQPTISSIEASAETIRSTEKPSSARIRPAAAATTFSSASPSATPPSSDMCTRPSALTTTGNPSSAAAAAASSAVPTRLASGNTRPPSARRSRAK
jgi:alkylation response protein AidB-like acyl-CoA dehydrogenase